MCVSSRGCGFLGVLPSWCPRESWLRAPGEGPRHSWLRPACGVGRVRVLVCCVVGGGPFPSLWPSCVCVCPNSAVCWFACCVEFVCAGLAACVWVCVRCGSSGARTLWYVVPVLVLFVRRHAHNRGLKKKSCKCVLCGVYYPRPSFCGCLLCLSFASQWYLRSVEVWRGVVLRVAWLFAWFCAWPYPLVSAFARWYVSLGLRFWYGKIPHCHTFCVSPIESMRTA